MAVQQVSGRKAVREAVYYSAADSPIILRLRRYTISMITYDIVRRYTYKTFVIIYKSSLGETVRHPRWHPTAPIQHHATVTAT